MTKDGSRYRNDREATDARPDGSRLLGKAALVGLLLLAIGLAIPSASAVSVADVDGISTDAVDTGNCPAIVLGHQVCYDWCADTAATCGPENDAWASASASWYNARACVTTNVQHVLC